MPKARVKVIKLPYRGEPTREAHITDEELRMIEAGKKIVRPIGRVALKSNLIWTAEDDEKLIRMRKEGKTSAEISMGMHRSKGSIEIRLYDLRRQEKPKNQRITKPWTPEEEENLIAAYKNGEMVSDICAETGRTRDAIEHRLRKLSNAGRLIMRPHGRTRKEK